MVHYIISMEVFEIHHHKSLQKPQNAFAAVLHLTKKLLPILGTCFLVRCALLRIIIATILRSNLLTSTYEEQKETNH